MARFILGISAYYHDSAAALVRDGVLLSAAQEERFSRRKHDSAFPSGAVSFALKHAGIDFDELDAVVYYENPWLKLERLSETYLTAAPRGLKSFMAAASEWFGEKLLLGDLLRRELGAISASGAFPASVPVLCTDHHEAHAASAYFASGLPEAAVLCIDAVGEWSTTSAWLGRGSSLEKLWELRFPHSLGLLYSAFTYHAGFRVNSGEYKLMGLAPYGKPSYVDKIYGELVDLKDDGTFRLDLRYFDFLVGEVMTNERFSSAFGGPPRVPESRITQRELDLARSIQEVTNEIVVRLATTLRRETGCRALCMAGGVALNCVANGRVLRQGLFDKVWIQPAAGDAGGAVGAALAVWQQRYGAADGRASTPDGADKMQGALLGPAYSTEAVRAYLDSIGATYEVMAEEGLMRRVAAALAAGKIVGWFQGRMEFGPRALGARSILADPRHPRMQSTLNLKTKFRESFRPFAPAVLRERAGEYFELSQESPYMLLAVPVVPGRRTTVAELDSEDLLERLAAPRSDIPAVTHVDYSARVQTVDRDVNPRFWKLLHTFEDQTGCGVLINTSFNVRGEPLVCTPEDAYRCFMRTKMDLLVIEDCLVRKEEQHASESDDWRRHAALD